MTIASTDATPAAGPTPLPDHPNGAVAAVSGEMTLDAQRILAETVERLVTERVRPLVGSFLLGVDPVELAQRDTKQLALAIGAHCDLATDRSIDTPQVRLRAPGDLGWGGDCAVIQVVTDDMPFLVDSAVIAVRKGGFDVELLLHPVLGANRDLGGRLVSLASSVEPGTHAESFLHLELDSVPTSSEAQKLVDLIETALSDVRAAVIDWSSMRTRALDLAADVRQLTARSSTWTIDPNEVAELLTWMEDGHFTLLGAIDHLVVGDRLVEQSHSALGILRERVGGTPVSEIIAPSSAWNANDVVLITKTNSMSTVHRVGNYDIVVIKRYDAAAGGPESGANPIGERRLVGLFTSDTYFRSPLEIPLLRTKLNTILDRSGFTATGHSGKELKSILVSHPRDELFATPVDELERTAHGIATLAERRRVKAFVRRDSERSVWSCLVYLPRDRYTTEVRQRVQQRLHKAVGGTTSTYTTTLTDSRLARILFTIPSGQTVVDDLGGLDAALSAATRTWADGLAEGLSNGLPSHATSTELERARFGEGLLERYRNAFPAGYTAETPISQAIDDVESIERALSINHLVVRVHSNTEEDVETADARISLYSPRQSLALADLLPVLANLGLRVIDEKAAEVDVEGNIVWIHDMGVTGPGIRGINPTGDLADRLCHSIDAIWHHQVDNDGFNQLVSMAGLTHHDVAMLRLYARHARQLGLGFSLEYMQQTLIEQHTIAALLSKIIRTKFNPDFTGTLAQRTGEVQVLEVELAAMLDAIPSLDQDRILRCMSSQVEASIRTNAYQSTRQALCVKFEPRRIPEAPEPRPRYEIFVSSPRVEGIHLRMGAVARGGLRWSDRHEDFRTEVLGLMKAQAVKNSVIVPAGAKGGFVVRRPALDGDRAAIQAEGIACYQIFIDALLDVTDNLIDGQVVHPDRVVRHDPPDTYLVVAADKGTATFSDIANAIAVERGFWLGDAFASGGSVGYDHKAMGITARGAWESVKRHFLRMGKDISSPTAEPFSVVGIGDMSGDVFGNGMLLCDKIRLVIAFDHRHVFIDPNPDPATSFAERKRLFALPRSSWEDYDHSLISHGGGIWPRSAKSIDLSAEAIETLGLDPEGNHQVTPTEVLNAALRAPVDLLWNGGIGTYVKSSTETHQQAGDRSNDILRADANQLRCKIIGEGGNLGMTQRARIEFARLGGWVNTDAIDNSAGVDTSDHEVNLKILVDRAVASGALPRADRNTLLGALIDEVAGLVLADNINQNRILGNGLVEAPGMIDLHSRYIDHLETEGRLDRKLEALPDALELAARRSGGGGLSIPELAVLMAHTKLWITDQLLDEEIGNDVALVNHLRDYFPREVVKRLGAQIETHPLRSEIIATVLANRVVNRNGSTFVFRLADETQASVSDVVRAHLAATDMLDIDGYWKEILALDGTITDAHQTELLLEADRAVERAARWLLRNRNLPLDHQGAAEAYRSTLVECVRRSRTDRRIRCRDAAGSARTFSRTRHFAHTCPESSSFRVRNKFARHYRSGYIERMAPRRGCPGVPHSRRSSSDWLVAKPYLASRSRRSMGFIGPSIHEG
jgi:glutamate dehydrogenase